jgi:hypothetical protein
MVLAFKPHDKGKTDFDDIFTLKRDLSKDINIDSPLFSLDNTFDHFFSEQN